MITLHSVTYRPEENFKAYKGETILVNPANILWAFRKKSTGDSLITTINFGSSSSVDVWESFEEIIALVKSKK